MKINNKLILFCILILYSYSIFPKKLQEFNMGVNLLPKSINPTKVWNYQHFLVIQNILDTLVTINENNEVSSSLAKSWSISEDGRRYTFSIDRNKYFSDGSKVLSSDIARSLSSHFIKNNKSVVKGYLQNIIDTNVQKGLLKCINVKSSYELEITLKHPYAPFLKVLSMPAFSIYKEKGANIIGSGPYIIKSKINKKIILENNKFSKKKAFIKRINITELNSKEVKQEYKRYDLLLGFTPDDVDSMTIVNEYKVDYLKSFVFFHFYFNTTKHPFDNIAFRSIFSNEFNKFLLSYKSSNEIIRINNFLPKGIVPTSYYKSNKEPSNATQSLKKYCESQRCQPIKITIRKEYLKKAFALSLVKYFKKLNIKIIIKIITKKEFIQNLKEKKYNIVTAGYFASFTDPDAFINLINNRSSFHYTDFNTQKYIKKINSANLLRNKIERLHVYINELKNIEKLNILIPGYQYLMPIIYKRKFMIPDWNYRTEGDIWKIKQISK